MSHQATTDLSIKKVSTLKGPQRCYPLFYLPLCHLQPLCHMESWLSSFGAVRITDFPHLRWLTLFSIRQLVIHLQFWKSGAAHGKGYLSSRQYPHYRARGGVLAQDTQPFLIEKLFIIQCVLMVFFTFPSCSQIFPPHYPPNSMPPPFPKQKYQETHKKHRKNKNENKQAKVQ